MTHRGRRLQALQQIRGRGIDGVDPLVGTSQDCLDDLRVVIHSLDGGERELPVVLGTLRFRLWPRIEAMGVRIEWQIEGPAVEWPALDPKATLEPLRIVKEAMTNCLKHSGATIVTRAVRIDVKVPVVQIIDNRKGAPAPLLEGRSLRNMHAR